MSGAGVFLAMLAVAEVERIEVSLDFKLNRTA